MSNGISESRNLGIPESRNISLLRHPVEKRDPWANANHTVVFSTRRHEDAKKSLRLCALASLRFNRAIARITEQWIPAFLSAIAHKREEGAGMTMQVDIPRFRDSEIPA